MGTFIVAFQTVLPLFLIIITGIIFTRLYKSSVTWVEVLNKYALLVGFPALVVASLMKLESINSSYMKLILYNSVYVVSCILLAFPIARIFRLTNTMRRALILILPFANIAYLGMPVLQNAMGDEIMPVAAILSAVYVFWMLTLALVLVEFTGEERVSVRKQTISLATNPLLLSVFIGLAIVLLNIELPPYIAKTIDLFAGSVTAVVLFSLGIFLGTQNVGKPKEWSRVILLVLTTMIVIPFLYYQVLIALKFDPVLTRASVIDAAMPLGVTPYALAVQYKLKSTLVARIVVLGTLLSMAIIPLWMVLLH